jgi:nickel-dependent lactate racemase
VVVSAGGYPKDINLYQAQKALDNAKHAVRKGGIIILAAACKEGFGEDVFEEWMTTIRTPEEMIKRIRDRFVLGGHKAAAIGLVLQNAEIYLVSELPLELVKSLNMKPFSGVNEAFAAACKELGSNAGAYIIPFGGSTLPYYPKS